jgi:hypothetical protein
VVKRILTTARNFSRFPFSGRIVPEFGDERISRMVRSQLSSHLSN